MLSVAVTLNTSPLTSNAVITFVTPSETNVKSALLKLISFKASSYFTDNILLSFTEISLAIGGIVSILLIINGEKINSLFIPVNNVLLFTDEVPLIAGDNV